MSKSSLLLALPLLAALAQPAPAFWDEAVSAFKSSTSKKDGDNAPQANKSEPSAWDKLSAQANKSLKEFEIDQGNADTPSWDELKDRAGKAMKKFAKDGKGFDIMRKIKRKAEKLAADEDSALTGRFYDLKQPVEQEDGRKARPLHQEKVTEFIRNYIESGWDNNLLEQYYSPDVELAAPYLYLPRCKASYAPKAFRCNEGKQERHVDPHAWVVVYSGEVTAPKTGHFRFVGMGDDTIVVRFNKEVVLESGWSINSAGSMNLGTKQHYKEYITSPKGGCALFQYEETPHWNQQLGGIQTGHKFHVQKGKTYPIQILVSEIPGNEFGFCLLIEELESGRAITGQYLPDESPVVHLFRTNETEPDLKEIEEALTADDEDYRVGSTLEIPPYKKNSPVWEIKSKAPRRNLLKRATATMSDEDTAMGRRKDAESTEENAPADDTAGDKE